MRRANFPLLLSLLLLAALPLLWMYLPPAADALQRGTDDRARNAVREAAPAYRPWLDSFWRPSDSTVERALFTLQAVIGVLVFYWSITALRARRTDR